jgi:alanine dehydrogenase
MRALVLSERDVESLLTMKQVLTTVETTYRAHGTGDSIVPAKITLDLSRGEGDAWMNAMPAYVVPLDAAGVKFAGGFALNPAKRHLPYIMGTILLIDPRDGTLLAVVGGRFITTARTGASAAVAAKYFAPEAEVAAVIGVGAVGSAAAIALGHTLPSLKEIRIHDISRETLDAAVQSLRSAASAQIRPAASSKAAVDGADVIVTATRASSPLFGRKDLKKRWLVITLGSSQELDEETVMSAGFRVVDHLEQNKHRGEFSRYLEDRRLSEADIHAEIGEIIAGTKPLPQRREGGCVASLIGVGSHDIAIAKLAYETAISRPATGTWVDL